MSGVECGFELAWVGACDEPAGASGRCDYHDGLRCEGCEGEPTRECDQTLGPFICSLPICDHCEHAPNVMGFAHRQVDSG